MNSKWISFFLILNVTYILTGCGPGIANQMIRITPASKTSPPVQAAQCAAQQSGWNITFKDEQSLSATKTVGMDNVPLKVDPIVQTNYYRV